MILIPPFPPSLFLPAGTAVAANHKDARAGTLEFLGETLETGLEEVRKHRLTDWKRSATGLEEVRAHAHNGLEEVRAPTRPAGRERWPRGETQ